MIPSFGAAPPLSQHEMADAVGRPRERAPLVRDRLVEILAVTLDELQGHRHTTLQSEFFEHALTETVNGRHGEPVDRRERHIEALRHPVAPRIEHRPHPRLVHLRHVAVAYLLRAMQVEPQSFLEFSRRCARECDREQPFRPVHQRQHTILEQQADRRSHHPRGLPRPGRGLDQVRSWPTDEVLGYAHAPSITTWARMNGSSTRSVHRTNAATNSASSSSIRRSGQQSWFHA